MICKFWYYHTTPSLKFEYESLLKLSKITMLLFIFDSNQAPVESFQRYGWALNAKFFGNNKKRKINESIEHFEVVYLHLKLVWLSLK